MSEHTHSDADPFGQIADEFVEAFRQGQHPSVEEFARRYPAHAEQIRDMLPALVLMEKAKSAEAPPQVPTPASVAAPLQQLGDYQILREVGRGGMGVVYEAQQLSLGRHVALKVLPSHALLDPRLLGRFEREVRAAARLHHTNIVPVFGVGEQDGLHYYVMQFIQGLGLDEVLAELRRLRQPGGQGPLTWDDAPGPPTQRTRAVSAVGVARGLLSGAFRPPEVASPLTTAEGEASPGTDLPTPPATPPADTSATIHMPGQSEGDTLTGSGRAYWQSVARVGMQVADALSYAAGQGILHRDVKPSNLLLDEGGNVWVTDFGLAKADSDADNLTHSGDIIGTLRYLAPERFHGQGDLRSDVYSLGLTLYELLTLRPAFDASDRNRLVRQVLHDEPPRPRKLNPAVPRDLETVVLKAIARDPEHRYQTPAELAEDLKRFVEDRPIRARRASEAEKFWRWCRRNPLPASLMALVMLAFLGGFAGVFWQWRRAESAREAEQVQRQGAERARDDAKAQTKRAEAALYNSNIARAQLQYGANKIADAEDILDRCDAGRRGWEWHFLKHLCHADLLTLRGHTSWVYAVAYSPDGKLLASAGGGNPFWPTQGEDSIKPAEIILWDADTGARLHTLEGHKHVINALAFSPDGKQLASGSEDGTVRLWDAASGEVLLTLPGRFPRSDPPGSGVSSLAYSPDGKFLAVGSFHSVTVWDLTRKPDPSSMPHSILQAPGGDLATGVAFSPDGMRLAVSTQTGQVQFADLAGGTEARRLEVNKGGMAGIAWSPDGRYLATWHTSGVQFWDAKTGKPLKTLSEGLRFFGGAFSPTGEQFAAGSNDGLVRIWSVPTGRVLHLFRGHRAKVWGVAFSVDGQRLASGSADGTVKVWDLTQDPEHGLVRHGRGQAYFEGLAFADQGRSLITAGVRVHALDCDTQARWRDLTTWGMRQVDLACLDGEGRWLVGTSREDPTVVKCWEVATGREQATLRGHQQALRFVTINAGGTHIATAGRPALGEPPHTEVKVWDMADGRPLLEWESDLLVSRIALSPDGDHLALAGLRYTPADTEQGPFTEPVVRVYEVRSGKVWREYVGPRVFGAEHEEVDLAFRSEGKPAAKVAKARSDLRMDLSFLGLAFNADGTRLAAAGIERTILLWDLSAEQPGVTHQGPEAAMDLTFSPDGRRLAVASREQIKLLDATSGEGVLTLLGRKHLNFDTWAFTPRVLFSPDGQRLVAICHSAYNPLALWSIGKEADQGPPQALRAAACRAIAVHLDFARAYAGKPEKRAAFDFHWKQVQGIEFTTAQEYLDRGALYVREGQLDEAAADFDRALELAREDSAIRYEVGVAYAAAGQWDRAAAHFDKYWDRGRGESWTFCYIAPLPLYRNDPATYRRYAQGLLERCRQSRDPAVITNLLFWGPLLSPEGGDPKESLRLIDRCLDRTKSRPTNSGMLIVKGMAEYRAGHYEAAVKWLGKAEPLVNARRKAGIQFFLSMAHHRLNQPEQARAAYQKGLEHLATEFGSPDRFTFRKDIWFFWLWGQVLRREAEAVLKEARKPQQPKG